MGNKKLVFTIITLTVVYFCLSSLFSSNSEAMSSSVVFATLLILIWYTFETRNIYLTTKRQVELQHKPILAIELQEETSLSLNVTNVGNGPAFNIEIPNVPLEQSDIYFKFDSISFLRAGDNKEIKIKNFREERKVAFPFDAHLRPKYANKEVKITLKFNDVEMKKIEQKFELGTGKLSIYINH